MAALTQRRAEGEDPDLLAGGGIGREMYEVPLPSQLGAGAF